MSRFIFFTIPVFCISILSLHAQSVIEGTIFDENGTGVADVSVILMQVADSSVVEFAMSDDNGKYKITYNRQNPEMLISVYAFDIKRQIKRIKNKPQIVDFYVEKEAMKLETVVVKSKKITMRSDTINYHVENFKNESDRTIRDVIEKMPGIKVDESGQITYNGKWVKDFYIEGLNMLQDNYGIAVNNINATDIATVQILENHQAVKALQGKERGTSPALNLKLKDSAKEIWSSNVLAQAGGGPFAYSGDINLMVFSRKRQNISYFKTNNIGRDLGADFMSDVSYNDAVSLKLPEPPNIDKSYYYMNHSNAATVNHLIKLEEDRQVTVNINYLNDRENRENTDFSQYYISNDSALSIHELLSSKVNANNLSTSVNYKDNNRRFYLQNTANAIFDFGNGTGNVQNNVENIYQKLDNNSFQLQNIFSYTNAQRKGVHSITSRLYLYRNPYDLDIFNDSVKMFSQHYKDRGALMKNSFTLFSSSVNYFRLDFNGKLNGSYNNIETTMDQNKNDDDSNNDISDYRYEALINPYLLFMKQNINATLSLPFGLKGISHDNKSIDDNQNVRYFYFSPKLSIDAKLNDYFNLTTYYSFSKDRLNPEFMMPNPYYKNYRTLYLGYPHAGMTKRHTANVMISFKDVFKMLFGSINVLFISSSSDNANTYRYDNYMTTIKRQPIDVNTENTQIDMSMGKGFYTWRASLAMQVIAGIQNSDHVINNRMMTGKYKYLNMNFQASFTPVRWMSFLTKSEVSLSENKVNGEKSGKNIVVWHNSTTTDFIIGRLVSNMQFDFFRNKQYDEGKNKVFLNAGFRYNLKSFTLTLNVQNVFNTKVYETISYSGADSFRHIYDLRHRTILGGVQFRIF